MYCIWCGHTKNRCLPYKPFTKTPIRSTFLNWFSKHLFFLTSLWNSPSRYYGIDRFMTWTPMSYCGGWSWGFSLTSSFTRSNSYAFIVFFLSKNHISHFLCCSHAKTIWKPLCMVVLRNVEDIPPDSSRWDYFSEMHVEQVCRTAKSSSSHRSQVRGQNVVKLSLSRQLSRGLKCFQSENKSQVDVVQNLLRSRIFISRTSQLISTVLHPISYWIFGGIFL